MGNAINAQKSNDMDSLTRLHRFRYHLAKGFIDVGDIVLDLGCGTGYGTKILSEVALKVIGVDIDEENIRGDVLNNNGDNIEYLCKDLEKWDIPECDVAVQFENLEHLYNPKKFVDRLKNKVDKYVVLSVPVGCEKLIEVNGKLQADLDLTHHSVFDTPEELDNLFLDDKWRKFYSFRSGIIYIAVYYNNEQF